MSDKNTASNRLNWVDQTKGLAIFLVVYGHNFPFCEKFIYAFHMPLFIMVSGFFHPKNSHLNDITKRITHIIFPYFSWSLLLFLFWFILGKNYGDSAQLNLSSIENFTGIFYAQGDRTFMDWGISLWFLPFIFMSFLLFYTLQKIKNQYIFWTALISIILAGFVYSRYFEFNLPWSFNIAMVGLIFYGFGFFGFKILNSVNQKNSISIVVVSGILLVLLYNFNVKIDMYRAIYGNEFLFIINGIIGSLFVLFFFKAFPIFKFLEFIGKFSLLILCLQLFAMTFIKFVLLYGFGQNNFNFTEWEKFVYAIVQIILIIPVFLIVNKYLPILNGGFKKI